MSQYAVTEPSCQTSAPFLLPKNYQIPTLASLQPGGQGFLVYVPIFEAQGFQGSIVGIVRAQELLASIVHATPAPGYALTLFDGEGAIYRQAVGSSYPALGQAQELTLPLYDVTWRLQLWPKPGLLAALRSR